MIVDFHTHIFSPEVRDNRSRYVERDPCFASLYSSEKAKLATAEDLIESMDRCGIALSVVLNIGWTTAQLCTETNDYILESVARFPKRFIGFCAIQPLFPDAAIAEIERCARAGAKGVGELRPDTQVFNPTDEKLAPVFKTLQQHNLILLAHTSEPVGHIYPGKGKVTPETVYPMIMQYPDLKMVCAHWGGGLPFYATMPEVKLVFKNVYFDTAASPFLYSPGIYGLVSRLVGADKVLFGSDYPLMSPARVRKEVDGAGLTDEEKGRILGGNAQRLLGI